MPSEKRVLGIGIILGFATWVAWIPQLAASHPAQGSTGSVPIYHGQLPDGPLPSTLSPNQFTEPQVKNAYAIAARIKKTLYQQPCYCQCDRSLGHQSLLDCYVSTHASRCDICMSETFYGYEQLKKGKTAAQIRDGIVRSEWEHIDIAKYQTYPMAPAKKK